ncbi:hypothetical protein MEG1DRAFT_00765 [Photorhabdus temperata subsp. temperata Meg1]|uniref:Uncharacterized protein n=1 Tax=Photorhabdus temperata subsp. temperata Meg1 TaxID=1393735 RepID=A0A081S0M3_PHOTE|nr:hypothetical protein MEG1DRAFT_00765 [Photorhabdus temperata subsp. temperata Meg1]
MTIIMVIQSARLWEENSMDILNGLYVINL